MSTTAHFSLLVYLKAFNKDSKSVMSTTAHFSSIVDSLPPHASQKQPSAPLAPLEESYAEETLVRFPKSMC